MHFGGIHFFIGLFFLLLSILLVCGYLLVASLLLPIAQRFIAFFKQKGYAECWPMLWLFLSGKRHILFSMVILVTVFFTIAYVPQRFVWMGSGNANFKAKEYYVAGLPLAGTRLILARFIHPDNPLMQPLTTLQWLIYNQGIKQLPENDGEIGIWADLWFNYPYILRMYQPYGTSDTEPSFNMRKLLDRIWFSMEAMSTRPFADKKMERRHYLLNFPRSAFYYALNDGYYNDRLIGAAYYLHQDSKFVEREHRLYEWTARLRQRWITVGMYEEIKKKYPKIEAERQLVAMKTLEVILRAPIYTGQYSCDLPYIPLYVEARREFVDKSAPNHVMKVLRRRQKSQAETLYSTGISGSVAASFHKYILKKYCGVEVLGNRQPLGLTHPVAIEREIKDEVTHLFRRELKLLEEGYHESK